MQLCGKGKLRLGLQWRSSCGWGDMMVREEAVEQHVVLLEW
jgi:hypothetical protein